MLKLDADEDSESDSDATEGTTISQMYQAIFPTAEHKKFIKHRKRNIQPSLLPKHFAAQLAAQFAKNAEPAHLSAILSDFLNTRCNKTTLRDRVPTFAYVAALSEDAMKATKDWQYEHDRLLYTATIHVEPFLVQGTCKPHLIIQLANSAFMYKRMLELLVPVVY